MKYLLMLDTPFWMILSLVLTTWIFRLKNQIKGINDPRMWLTRKERRELARESIRELAYQRNLNVLRDGIAGAKPSLPNTFRENP